jgi:hypothetical protein
MNNHELIVVAVLLLSAAMLYRKFANKNKGKAGLSDKTKSGSLFSSASDAEEYEPYSKKKDKE